MEGDQAPATATAPSCLEESMRMAQVEARTRHISHNVCCLECGHQSIEEFAADITVRLHRVIRDHICASRIDKEIYARLISEYGKTILYQTAFDAQIVVLWLGPVAVIGAISGATFYRGREGVVKSHALVKGLEAKEWLNPMNFEYELRI